MYRSLLLRGAPCKPIRSWRQLMRHHSIIPAQSKAYPSPLIQQAQMPDQFHPQSSSRRRRYLTTTAASTVLNHPPSTKDETLLPMTSLSPPPLLASSPSHPQESFRVLYITHTTSRPRRSHSRSTQSPHPTPSHPKPPSPVDEFLQRGYTVDLLEFSDLPAADALHHWHHLSHTYVAVVLTVELETTFNLLPLYASLDAAASLRFMGVPASMVSRMDLAAATRAGLLVLTDTPTAFQHASQEVMELLLTHTQSPTHPDATPKLHGKVLGLLGFSPVGQAMARLAQSFGMTVRCYDPSLPTASASACVAGKEETTRVATLVDLCLTCDYMAMDAPVTVATRECLTLALLDTASSQCKVLVRQASDRALLHPDVPADRLLVLEALNVSHDDEDEDERMRLNAPAFVSQSLTENMWRTDATTTNAKVALLLCEALAARAFTGIAPATLSYLSTSLRSEVRPFVQLATALGRLVSALDRDSTLSMLHVETSFGADMETTSELEACCLAACLVGIFTPLLDAGCSDRSSPLVNLVNARGKAQAAGILTSTQAPPVSSFVSSSSPPTTPSFRNTMTVTATYGNATRPCQPSSSRRVIGSVFGTEPRVVQIDDNRAFPPFVPTGNLLFFTNLDAPGAMAQLLEVLATSAINVGQLGLGRASDTHACGMLTLDSPVSPTVLSQLTALTTLQHVHTVALGPLV